MPSLRIVRLRQQSSSALRGPDPVRWWENSRRGEIPVPQIAAVDTLGAGDVFHGAYAYALAAGADLEERIRYAAEVASARDQRPVGRPVEAT